MSDLPDVVARLTRSLAAMPPTQPLPLRLCTAVVEVSEARDSAIALGVSVSRRTLVYATSEIAARFEDAQDLVREGPSLDALRSGQAISSYADAERRRRWPSLTDAVSGLPPTVVHALPMRSHAALIGVLTVHHDPDPLPRFAVADLQLLADTVGTAVLDEIADQPRDPHEAGLLWSERDRVSQATGMIVAQLALAPRDALALLRAHAFSHEASVLEISRRVLARELDFSHLDGERP